MLRCGARWSYLPERYGKCKSAHRRFVRWAHSGKQIFHELVWNQKNQYLMINSTLVRADQQAATGRKRGAVGALGIARGGLSINIHSLAGERVCHAPAAYRYGLGLQSLQFIDLGYLLVPSGTIHLYQGARDHLLLLL